MKKGVIEYDDSGKPRCHICGKSFDRVLNHVRAAHGLSGEQYRKRFGLNRSGGICSQESKDKSRRAVKVNEHVVKVNLEKGAVNRFSPGHEGRTRDKVRMQERYRLRVCACSNMSEAKRKELGRALGLSGLGNKVRWGTGKVKG